MTAATVFHDIAMDYYDLGRIAKAKSKPEVYEDYLQKAYILEKEAALKGQADLNDQFWKYVYARSAAYLAVECGKLQEAKRLVQIGLAGTPPESEKSQLKEALKEINEKIDAHGDNQNDDSLRFISGVIISFDLEKQLMKIKEIGTQQYYLIKVPTEYLSDIARLYLGETVKVSAIGLDKEDYILEKIQFAT